MIDLIFLLASGAAASTLFGCVLRFIGDSTRYIMGAVDAMLAILYIFWIIYATVARFSHTGRVCSGYF